MSRVTNIILTVSAGEFNVAEWLNRAWSTDGCPPWREAEYSAGCKAMECGVFLGGFNHMDLSDFTKAIESITWEHPECVQLFVMEEEDSRFREIVLWSSGQE